MKTKSLLFYLLLSSASLANAAPDSIDRGRYLVAVGGCNDCHTPGFAESGGTTLEAKRFLGNEVGFSGPWGVSYAGNLRLAVQRMSGEQWVERVSKPGMPPMPWPAVMAMTKEDKIAVYDYLRSLGPDGVEAPAYQPPGTPIKTMHIPFVPQPADNAAVNAAVSMSH